MAPVKHGATIGGKPTKLYGAWQTMIGKCENPNHSRYPWYGAKGVRVCERWHDFAKFYEDVGERPGPTYSLDRYPDYRGNYEPGNVRWATKTEQSNNKADGVGSAGVHLISLPDGRRMSIAMAARTMGISRLTLNSRIKKGVPQEHLFDPPGPTSGRRRNHSSS